jgi:hypothetical protein
MATVTTDVASLRAPARPLDVVAIVCAVVLPPVGAILGLVSRSAAKDAALVPNLVSSAAIVIGTLITGIAVLFVLAPLLAAVVFLG